MTITAKAGSETGENSVVAALRSDLQAIEGEDTLFEESNFASRSAAIDFLDFQIIDRISGLLERPGPTAALELLRERAERIKRELEKIDGCLFERIRGEIAAGVQRGFFERMIRHCLVDDEATDERDYDLLDAFVNGLFSDRPLPEQTLELMPGMVSFHKTPVRIVLELVRMAEMGSGDVFFDIGSGLGQVVLLVNLISGARAKGIEYEPAYCAYAGAVASRLRLTDTEFINVDARKGDYSNGTVFFLYTPFDGSMLREMMQLLEQASRDRVIRIFTYGPCSAAVAAENWLQCVNGLPDDPYKLYLFKSY